MRVRQDDEVDRARIEPERYSVACARAGRALKHTAVHQEAGLRGFKQEAGTRYLSGGSMKCNVHRPVSGAPPCQGVTPIPEAVERDGKAGSGRMRSGAGSATNCSTAKGNGSHHSTPTP